MDAGTSGGSGSESVAANLPLAVDAEASGGNSGASGSVTALADGVGVGPYEEAELSQNIEVGR